MVVMERFCFYNQRQQYNFMAEFLKLEGQHLIFRNLFNEEHTQELLATIQSPISSLEFRNVGVKVMRLILGAFSEAPIRSITLDYDWNVIMTTPQLVCYDKAQWKTLQQLSNWNREWNQLFSQCYDLQNASLNIRCSWMDDQFAKKLLEGLVRLPNIGRVQVQLSSKAKSVEEVLVAFEKAAIFQQYKYGFTLQK